MFGGVDGFCLDKAGRNFETSGFVMSADEDVVLESLYAFACIDS